MCHGRHASSSSSSADAKKLKAVADQYELSKNPADLAKLGAQIASQFADESSDRTASKPVLAIPFAAPAGDAAAVKLADAAFAQTYGRLALSLHGQISLESDSAGSKDAHAAVQKARNHRADYVVYGAVSAQPSGEALVVTVADAAHDSVLWTQTYPVGSADPLKIASDVQSQVPQRQSD
jgi:TolB-like protein